MPKLLEILKRATALPEQDLRRIISNAPERYKTYPIARRNSEKPRMISQPAKEVKLLQRVLMHELLSHFPIHPAASAYKDGASIKKNAEAHAQSGPILKFDFVNFFPSIRDVDWMMFAQRNGLEQEDAEIAKQIFFKREPRMRGLRLSIGAPSSPSLSNILLFDIDRRISTEIASKNVTYTRYADDLTFSAPRTGYLNRVEKNLRLILREADFPMLRINDDKTILATKKFKRQVTGLIITNEGGVSVGRERKRNIFAAVHYIIQNGADIKKLNHVLGLISFVSSVESDFSARLERKYGVGVVQRLHTMMSQLQAAQDRGYPHSVVPYPRSGAKPDGA